MRVVLALLLLLPLAGCGIPASSLAAAGVSIVGNIVVDVFDITKDLKEMKNGPAPPANPPPPKEAPK